MSDRELQALITGGCTEPEYTGERKWQPPHDRFESDCSRDIDPSDYATALSEPTDNQVEAVARTIWDDHYTGGSWEQTSVETRETLRDAAKRVLQVAREAGQ